MLRKIVSDKICHNCGVRFNRSKLKNGRPESLSDYGIRKYCSRACFLNGTQDKITVYTKTVFGEDMVADTYAYRMENMFIELLGSKNYGVRFGRTSSFIT